MNKDFFEVESVKKILKLREETLKNIKNDKSIVEVINNFFHDVLIYVSFYGIDDIRLILNILVNFIFDNYGQKLNLCNQELIFQFIKLLDYYPHINKIKLSYDSFDFIDYLNIEIRKINEMLFNDNQLALYKNIISKNQIIYSAPTSYGKTSVCINGFLDLLKLDKMNNLLILVPTKALINEYKKMISNRRKQTDIIVNVIESAYAEFNSNANTKNIYIFTQERVLTFFSSNERINSIDYILIDEAQSISYLKDRRTPLLLKAISMFPNCQKIYLTPFVKNFNNNIIKKVDNYNIFDEIVVTGKESLVANNKFIVDVHNNEKVIVRDVTFDLAKDFLSYEKKFFNSPHAEFLNVVPFIVNNLCKDDKTIIFTSNKNNSIDWPLLFIDYIPNMNNKSSKRLRALITHLKNNIHKDFDLIDYLNHGIAYHNSYLDNYTKRQIEYIFTEEFGVINYLFCTNTIGQGVNFSAKNLFIFVKQIRSDNPQLDFVNLLGRAARLSHNGLGNLYFVKTSNKSKYEDIFMKSNDNLDIKLSKLSIKDIEKNENVELRSYIADNCIENESKKQIINSNYNEILNLGIKFESIDQMNYSINQSNILKIESSINLLDESTINKYLKFYQNYNSTYEFIEFLKKTYDWENIYAHSSSYDSWKNKRILNTEFIATIITKLIHGNTINEIISSNIKDNRYNNLYINTDKKMISSKEQIGYEPCNLNNKKHINIIIVNSLFDVQNIIEFEVKKYIQDFYYRVNKMHNIKYKDQNVENFIDFSTIDIKKVKLINAGVIDTFAINKIIESGKYDDLLEKKDVDLVSLCNRIFHIEGDESPLYYAIKDVI